jgi:leader peptidase (prepilin peptidase)/N-methyltransferase
MMPEITAGLILGLLVGSFLNVVIYRLPVMMERRWRREWQEVAAAEKASPGTPPPKLVPEPRFDLMAPRSACPACSAQITAWQNIPVVSWLLLRGRCAACAAPIAARYPLIELLTGLLSAVVIWQLGWGPGGWAGLAFLWALIALTFIDFDHQLLPDDITYPLLWAGLGLSATATVTSFSATLPVPDLPSAVIGAILGYLSLWLVYWLFKLVTGKEGMGYGDFKLLAALGAWTGYQMLPLIIMISATLGAVVGICMIIMLGRDRQIPLPFGPYLAGAGFVALLWGEPLVQAYLDYSGL